MYTTTFILSLLSIPIVSAGQHTGHHFRAASRRHHARMVQPLTRQAGCEEASWQCSGSELQRCIGNQWQSIQQCSGQDIICSASTELTGCVYTWSVEQGSTDNSTGPASPPSPASSLVPSSTPSSSAVSSPSTPSSITMPVCEDGEEEYEEDVDDDESRSASVTGAASSETAAASVIGGNLAAGGGGGHSWYTRSRDDWQGGASGGWSASSSTDAWSASSSSIDPWASPSSTDWSDGAWSSSAWSASATPTDQWGQPAPTDSASATATEDWQQSGSPTSSPTRGGHGGDKTTFTGASLPANSTGSGHGSGGSGGSGNGGGSQGNWNAPHYVVYSDYWLHQMPDVSSLAQFNRFILAFWMSDRGAVDNAQMWEWMDAGDRQQVLDSYHSAGIALMVSAFGSTDSPVTSGVDAADCARRLAAWVKQYNLDGVDVDWEDMQAMNTNRGEAWLITFQSELRRQLPAGQYLISHAPVAPWFTSAPDYESGAYVKVHQEVGSGIDFYNIQFYNQGAGVYEDCQSLIVDSSASSWPDTSVLEINSYAGVSYSKIVIGKPINAGAAANGYMDPSTLSQCVEQAESKGWNGGIMYWEWNSDAPSIMATSRGQ